MAAGGEIDFAFYRYTPSLAAAVIFTVLFAIVTLVHLYWLVRAKTWYFIPFVIGGFCEAIGYVGRAIAAVQAPHYTRDPYIMQSLLILIGPAFFAASIYMVLGRIIRLVDGERHAIIRSTWLTKIFVSSDVLCFLLQGAGGGLLAGAKTLSAFQLGEDVIIGGLFVQLIGFGVFLLVAGLFHRRIVRQPTPASRSAAVPWRRFLFVLYAASACILVRSLFRVVEFIMGYSSPLQKTEFWLYVFDAALMFVCMLVFAVFHPSRIISAGAAAAAAGSHETSSSVAVGAAPKAYGESGAESEMEMQHAPRRNDVETGVAGGLSGNSYYKLPSRG